MREVILTNEQNRSMNSNARRVVAEGTRPTTEEARSTTEEARPMTEGVRLHTSEEIRPSSLEELRLFTASEAARILHVSRNAIYALWRDGQLDFWRLNGTMTTNLNAIQDFLERTKNADLGIDRSLV